MIDPSSRGGRTSVLTGGIGAQSVFARAHFLRRALPRVSHAHRDLRQRRPCIFWQKPAFLYPLPINGVAGDLDQPAVDLAVEHGIQPPVVTRHYDVAAHEGRVLEIEFLAASVGGVPCRLVVKVQLPTAGGGLPHGIVVRNPGASLLFGKLPLRQGCGREDDLQHDCSRQGPQSVHSPIPIRSDHAF